MEEKSERELFEEYLNRHPDLRDECWTCTLITNLGGFMAGAFRGFCKARDIHTDLGIENYVAITPALFGIVSGGAMQRKVFYATAKDEIEKQGRTLDVLEGKSCRIGGLGSTVIGAIYGGTIGLVSTAIGFGAGYGVGFLTR